jgi:hypothetical protein
MPANASPAAKASCRADPRFFLLLTKTLLFPKTSIGCGGPELPQRSNFAAREIAPVISPRDAARTFVLGPLDGAGEYRQVAMHSIENLLKM